ncbi:hypothetical protein [Aquimarina sp. AU58]|uniref:hypothetical protein n=1 Tax=Aquimarina sp. AU58 TaxID=1874112 RepID=UPI001F1B2FE6|nr:hypothetical protein [Aquimarina sp. AU58]
MKRLAILLLFSFAGIVHAQHMDNTKLELIIKKNADTLDGIPGNWKFIYKDTPMLCVTDETNNRMRIISPITASDRLDKDILLDAMTANFHSALDVKYAITNKILWSVYIHPLKELTNEQVNSAISQVYYAAKTFGTTFSSTELIFGAGSIKEKTKDATPEEKIHKF